MCKCSSVASLLTQGSHGVPDAPKGSSELREEVRRQVADLESRGDWEAGLRLLREKAPVRAEQLFPNDWYRLSRGLEVALARQGEGDDCDGPSRVPPLENCDLRCFFVSEDREELYHTIDARCLDMLGAGLLEEVTQLLVEGCLPPDFVGSRSIGYRQAIKVGRPPLPRSI